jgi:hypothetical protein
MITAIKRAAVQDSADTHWYTPCQDGVVWLTDKGGGKLAIEWARTKLGYPASEWWPVFLVPESDRTVDWLYFVRRTWTLGQLNEKNFINTGIPQADRS